jgi:hypothetical protein
MSKLRRVVELSRQFQSLWGPRLVHYKEGVPRRARRLEEGIEVFSFPINFKVLGTEDIYIKGNYKEGRRGDKQASRVHRPPYYNAPMTALDY